MAEALAGIEDRGPEALEELCREHPEQADALRSRVEWLLERNLAEPAAGDEREFPDRLGDFRLIERIGQGGMGVVYRAEQLSLGREVALKLVRPEMLYFQGALERFEHEVTTVAGLAHPGIVPVYSVGREDGIPFFAMEHVRGASLGAVIESLCGREPGELTGADLLRTLEKLGADPEEEASPLFDGHWPAVCTRIMREVAEALEHAHRRGILHRDVKPSNVMLTRGGRVMLLDFGLSSRETLEERRTKTGQHVGTLAYMAPEQLRGERELDARADVFAMGVMLYELLALRLPYDASSGAKRMSASEEPIPGNLRKLDGRVSWELETVVQAAGDPDSRRRYATSGDFARDLDHVLANRPIEARRSSPFLRARRWGQRHPAAALGLLVVVLGPSVLALQEYRTSGILRAQGVELANSNLALAQALEETELQREAADDSRRRADRHFERAYEAVEMMLSRVAGEELDGVPGMDDIRTGLLEDALRLHEELLEEQAGDPTQQELYARTLARTAELQNQLGMFDESFATLEREAALLDERLADRGEEEVVLERASMDSRLSGIAMRQERWREAERFARRSLERWSELDDSETVRETELMWRKALVRLKLSQILIESGPVEDGREELRLAIETLRELVEQEPANWDYRTVLAKALYTMGDFPSTSLPGGEGHDPARGGGWLEQSLAVRRELVAERPRDPNARRGLAETELALGTALFNLGLLDECEQHLRASLAVYEGLVREFPRWPLFTAGLATSCYDLSHVAKARGQHEERVSLLERAHALFEELLADKPERRDYRRRSALTLVNLGHALATGAEIERGLELLERSLEIGVPVWRDGRNDDPLRATLVWSIAVLGRTSLEGGDAQRAVAASGWYTELDPIPQELIYRAYFLTAAVPLGREDGLPEETLAEWTDGALSALEQAAESAPEDPGVREALVDSVFDSIAEEPRYVGLMERLGLER